MLSVPPKDSSSAAESAASPAIVVPSTTNNVHTTNKNHTSISSSSSNNNHSNNNHHHHHRFSIFGQEPSLELAAIVTIYFVQGALGLSRLAQTYLLKDELHLGPAELSAMAGLVTLPWTIKPVYGFLSDGVPLWGYRRKSYLFLAGLVGGWSYALLGWPFLWDQLPEVVVAAAAATTTAVNENNHQLVALIGTMAALVVSSACIAMSDVVADGMVVTRTRETASSDPSLAGALQSLCWGASALGGLMSAYFSGSLLQVMSIRQVFAWTAILPFLVAAIAIGIPEEPVALSQALDRATIIPDTKTDTDMNTDTNTTTETITTTTTTTLLDGVKEQATALWTAFQQPSLWRPALFLFLWQSTPTADGAFFFFLTEDLHLGPEFLGRVRFLSSAASLLGVWLYQQYWRRAKIKDLLFWTTIVSAPLGMIPVLLTTHVNRLLGIPDAALILGDDVVLAALGQIAFLPTLVLAARLCPLGIEAVLFATLMSIFNGASTVGTELGAALTKLFGVTESNFDHLYVW